MRYIVLVMVLLAACSTTRTQLPDNFLADEEKVLTKALAIRAKVLEKASKISFTSDPKVKLKNLSDGNSRTAGRYVVETGEIEFSLIIWSDLNIRLGKALRLADPKDVANDVGFQGHADHELGHALMDQVSRRSGNGAWFTKEQFYSLKDSEAFGMNVVSEGTATWFAGLIHSLQGKYSEEYFPENRYERGYTFDLVAYSGGYWLVRDILNQHGRRGLIWMISHPPKLGDEMRADALAYRTLALQELARKH